MNELLNFSLDTENAEKNYNLAVWYENQQQYAPAHTYYLRSAERFENDVLAYKSLLRSSFCYRSQGSRDGTEKIALENALNLLPQRPEAYYFLSLFYERKGDWQSCYNYANLGLQCYNQEIMEIDILEYGGKHLLIFQKAIAGWWWGKGMESRKLFHSLVDDYWEILEESYKKAVEDNITRLGSGPESQAFTFYDKTKKLRYEFFGSKTIEKNYSQVYQDIFVLSMLNGKRNGTFLEVGGSRPYYGNNTALLEEQFDWNGISIECNQEFVNEYQASRKTKVFCTDALKLNYEKILRENFKDTIIDYLQLDIEPARNTFEVLLSIPFDKYQFRVITYEHDYYVDVTKSYREKSRKYLKLMGYELVVNDISPDGLSSFEDWWVHPNLVDDKIFKEMKCLSNSINKAKTYMQG
jgi:hypothetical protein